MTRAELFEEDIIMKNNSSIKTVVAVGIGAALFFVLGRFVAIPSPVPNTNISLQYAVLALLAAMYGPVAGGLIGFIGHALIDLSWGGSPWWSWVITSAFVGVVIGLFAKKLNVQDGEFGKGKVVVFVVSNVIAHVIGWVVVAPVLDILIYAEPANKVFAQGVFAAAHLHYLLLSASEFHHTVNAAAGSFHYILRKFDHFSACSFEAVVNIHQSGDLHVHTGQHDRQWIKFLIRAFEL